MKEKIRKMMERETAKIVTMVGNLTKMIKMIKLRNHLVLKNGLLPKTFASHTRMIIVIKALAMTTAMGKWCCIAVLGVSTRIEDICFIATPLVTRRLIPFGGPAPNAARRAAGGPKSDAGQPNSDNLSQNTLKNKFSNKLTDNDSVAPNQNTFDSNLKIVTWK